MIAYLAGSCFPNCHPAGQTSAMQSSGNIALALGLICLIAFAVLAVKGK